MSTFHFGQVKMLTPFVFNLALNNGDEFNIEAQMAPPDGRSGLKIPLYVEIDQAVLDSARRLRSVPEIGTLPTILGALNSALPANLAKKIRDEILPRTDAGKLDETLVAAVRFAAEKEDPGGFSSSFFVLQK